MGLQRLFSATTAVVGLFISVDYGLCDGFRCRGIDLPTLPSSQLKQDHHTTVGWQGRAIWTLIYIIGIGLWTLHLSLLEGHVVTFSNVCYYNDYYIIINIFFKLNFHFFIPLRILKIFLKIIF